jgi:hypothetical protein
MEFDNIWTASAFVYDKQTEPIKYPLSYQEILALAYLKRKREEVIEQKFSWICAFDGRHRSGKSITAITLATIFDKTFWPNMENRIVYDPDEIIEQFDVIAKNNIHGAVIIIDEAGAALAGTDWYERVQKSIVKTIQIFGRWHPIIFLVAPSRDFIASGIRRMFHSAFKIQRPNNNETWIIAREITWHDGLKKPFYRRPVINLFNQKITMDKIIMTIPPKEILERYEEIEKVRKEKLQQKFKEESKYNKLKQQQEVVDDESNIKFIMDNKMLFESKSSRPDQPTIDETEIRFRLKMTPSRAKWYKREVERRLQKKVSEIIGSTELME